MQFDVLVIGGGHAGCEAAYASAKIGARTALLVIDKKKIAVMSCNPAIGGLAKGQLVKEIDALGGLMGMNTDKAAIQYRQLNTKKGPAVRSSRAQCDKNIYASEAQKFLETVPDLEIVEDEATELDVRGGKVFGVKTKSGISISAEAVVITTGTFLRAIMHTGGEQKSGGRVGEKAAFRLSDSIQNLGLKMRRLKTGTPPRLHKDSVNWEKLEPQPGDINPRPFSFYFRPERFPVLKQINCHITYTNPKTHKIIARDLHHSPMMTGAVTGPGPRYCPSIEDKVQRFATKDRHQIFLEPEGLDVADVYVNGVSTSLPRTTQLEFIRSINGLERADILRYGYAVEYDALDARQLGQTLECKNIQGAYFAGQVNGTSGYEEAGAQGLVAGANAALKVLRRDPLILRRDEAYVGVMIDDLVLKGSAEPYRMFTSRAEYRLLLREDNADTRLGPKARACGLLDDSKQRTLEKKIAGIDGLWQKLNTTYFYPGQDLSLVFGPKGWPEIKDRLSALEILRRPGIGREDLGQLGVALKDENEEVFEHVSIQTKYAGYIKRDLELLEGVRKSEFLKIPFNIDYGSVSGLSNEVLGILQETRPETLGQVTRIPGITPASVANLLIFLKMRERDTPQGTRNRKGQTL